LSPSYIATGDSKQYALYYLLLILLLVQLLLTTNYTTTANYTTTNYYIYLLTTAHPPLRQANHCQPNTLRPTCPPCVQQTSMPCIPVFASRTWAQLLPIGVLVKESELDIIVYYLARDEEKGGDWNHSDP
jgi:hypothetical protein